MKAKETISVFGLGKLGCTMLSCFAHKGWQVIGVDVVKEVVEAVKNGVSPIYEPGVNELLKNNKQHISATMNPREAILSSDVSFVIVPTPSNNDGSFNTKFVEAAVAEIGSVLQAKDGYHLVVITSTVLPGDMEFIVNLLERTSGKKVGHGFGVCYNPDFIALGRIVHDFLNPDMVLIGESDEKAGTILAGIHHNLVDNNPTIHRMNFHNAELTKIALNSFCTLKITFANILAEICEKMPGGDVHAVTTALGDDTRIGNRYLKGGLSYGGPCFPRDNRAFAHSAHKFGVTHHLANRTDEINDFQRNTRIGDLLMDMLNEKKTNHLSILGLTYKENSTLVEESAAISIIESLAKKGVEIAVYDPVAIEEARVELKNIEKIKYARSAYDCLRGTKVCFVATPWAEFKKLTREDFLTTMEKPVIFDAWNLYAFENDDRIDYRQIGKATVNEI